MKDRIVQVRKKVGLSQSEFAEKLNLSRNFISLVENGNREISERTIKDICREFKISYQWLVHGIGDMYNDDSDAQAIIDSVMTGDNEFAKKMLVRFAKLSDKHWEQLKEILEELSRED